MKSLLTLLLLLATAHGQIHSRIALPYMSQPEASQQSGTLDPGFLFWMEEHGPERLYITLGGFGGYTAITPPVPNWSTHPATQTVILNQNEIHLDSRYRWRGTGTASAWGTLWTDMLRISGGSELMRIISITFNTAANQIELYLDAGQSGVSPAIQYTNDLTADPQVWTEVEVYTLSPTTTGPDGRTTAYISPHVPGAAPEDPLTFASYYRFTAPPVAPLQIELLADTTITGDLTVTGTIPRAADIDDGVTAHTWGNHALAGYLTVQTTTYTLGFFEAPLSDEIDWLLIAQASTIAQATPGQAYARTVHNAETTYTLHKNNGASLGTVVFAASANAGTITLSAAIALTPGDRLEIKAPATPNAVGANLQITLIGELQ